MKFSFICYVNAYFFITLIHSFYNPIYPLRSNRTKRRLLFCVVFAKKVSVFALTFWMYISIYFSTEIASKIVFSSASFPYLSTWALFFSPWVRHPAPPIQPPTHAMPSIKFSFKTFLLFLSRAFLHSSIPSHEIALSSKSSSPCSLKPSATASASPPQRAKILPKYEALSRKS